MPTPTSWKWRLLNLAVNARDAMPDGGRIVVSARDEVIGAGETSGLNPGRLRLRRVSDTGQGMDSATLSRATEPFFTTKGAGKGTGLGLSMVHGLAEQSGGQFKLVSHVGEGTTAELWLPAADGAAPAIEQASSPGKNEIARADSMVVLAVDDDSLVLNNTVAMLEDLGHRCIAASSGSAAIEVLRQDQAVDLVITDQVMPQMTGLQLANAIKAQWPDLPVIVATGFAEMPSGSEAFLRLSKPFTQSELAEKLVHVGARSARTESLRRARGGT